MNVVLDGTEHVMDATGECDACWKGYPRPCECGGLVHASFGDEDYDGDYWLYKLCSLCGDQHDEKEVSA